MAPEELLLFLSVGWFAVASAVYVGAKAALSAQFGEAAPATAAASDDETEQ